MFILECVLLQWSALRREGHGFHQLLLVLWCQTVPETNLLQRLFTEHIYNEGLLVALQRRIQVSYCLLRLSPQHENTCLNGPQGWKLDNV